MKKYRDLKGVINTAREEGELEGNLEERKEIAKNLLDVLDDKTISKKTGLSIEEIKRMRK